MIAYYKDGIKTYKVLKNKNYKKKKRNSTEKAFLEKIDFVFHSPNIEGETLNKNTVDDKLSENCNDYVEWIDYTYCLIGLVNPCTGRERTIDFAGKGEGGCGSGDLDEVILYVPNEDCPEGYEESEHGVCQPIGSDTGGGSTGSDDSGGECDELDFECDTDNGGGGTDGDDPVDEDDCDTSKDDLKKVFPNTSDVRLTEIADAINKYAKDFGIDTKYKLQHFIAQAGHESANFTRFKEITGYKIQVLHLKWPQHFNPYTDTNKNPDKLNPNDYANSGGVFVDDEKFYNYVYNDENRAKGWKMGNTEVGDGYKFIGRGIWMLTGRDNYENFNTFYKSNYDSNVDVISDPSLLTRNSKIAIISALWFFQKKLGIEIDSNTTVEEVTKSVNGGTNGLSDRKNKFEKTQTNIDCN